MHIELRFFASVREQLGLGQERVAVPAEVATVADLRQWLGARGRRLGPEGPGRGPCLAHGRGPRGGRRGQRAGRWLRSGVFPARDRRLR
ncbi:molybdopterin converting factor, subunit 1 [Cupriavidus basilensis OR16]|uniref:Molybdopterin converting factor, subunit 1 n=1 Tax=Cupriavidus basilensis OR16 TaxID=1127483 RepID=H1SCJ1_9BURK|nr:molybdopterin converting factor, subunit 1 [Cupriavidus basilensis OR16]